MKKFLSVVLAMFLIFALVGCNDVDDFSSKNSSIISTGSTSEVESIVESSSQSECTTSKEQTSEESQVISSEIAPMVNNKTINIPIDIVFQGANSDIKNHQTENYDVVAGDIILLNFDISTEEKLATIIKTTINYDSTILKFESCTNTNYAGNVPGTFTVTSFGDNTVGYRVTHTIKLKAISSGSINIPSVISAYFVATERDEAIKKFQGIS